MKLRLAANALRLRILRSELALLEKGEALHETVRIASGPFGNITYSLSVAKESSPFALQVTCDRGAVQVILSPEVFATWRDPNQVGVYESVDAGESKPLQVVLEKDFACLDRNDATSDTFEHPATDAVC